MVALVGVASLWLSNTLAAQRERLQTQARLQELLDTVERSARIACFLQDRQLAGEVSQGLLSNRIVAWVAIFAGATELTQASQRPATAGISAIDAPVDPESLIVRKIISPFNSDEIVGEIRLAPDRAEIERHVGQASYFIGILLIVQTMAVGVAVVLVVYGSITRALKQISGHLRNLPAEQGAKLPLPAGHETDEIGGLVTYTNRLVDRLVGLLNEERHLRLQREIEERKFRSIFENADTGIFLVDQSGNMLSYNPACREIVRAAGYLTEGTISGIAGFLGGNETEAQNLIEACYEEGNNIQRDIHLSGKNGKSDRWVHLTLSKIENVVFQGVANDITERKIAELAAQKSAMTDAMTGLLNRMGFETKLRSRIDQDYRQSGHGVALMLIDLDFFKQVNDTYGHDAGDRVLIHFSRLLESAVRKSDVIGRLGGDEFVILLDYIDRPDVLERIAQKIISSVAKPIDIGEGRTAHVGSSIGIAFEQGEAIDQDVLFKKADEAMYQAKQSGRNTYCLFTEAASQVTISSSPERYSS
ncbi:MAG TPA: sensor domain-containing diguanylate cyclase [Candidatus Competibacter sp.]|nr:sensor domain-containing diguanylate cyclase [Candidatus Competibacter sp.]